LYDAFMFDLGRVIVDFDHWISARKIAPLCNKDPEEIYNMFFDSELTVKFDSGAITPQEFFVEVEKILGLDITYDEFIAIWTNIFFEKKDMSEFIRELKEDYYIGLISNVNILQFSHIRNKFPIVSEFEKPILSYEVGAMKPDPKIYEAAIKLCNTRPEKIIYIDDRPELVEGGKRMGLESIVFRDLTHLKTHLKELGVKL